MSIPIEVIVILVAVIVFGVAAYLHKSLEAVGLFFMALALMFHFGVRIG